MVCFLYVAVTVQARKQSQDDYEKNKGFITGMRPYHSVGGEK